MKSREIALNILIDVNINGRILIMQSIREQRI